MELIAGLKCNGKKLHVIFFFATEKNGCALQEATQLVKHILDKCPSLELIGLMTIGKFGHDLSQGPNPDFIVSMTSRICSIFLGLFTSIRLVWYSAFLIL